MLGLTIWLGYFARRDDFGSFIGAYGLFFGLYALLVFREKPVDNDAIWYRNLGIVLRIALLFSLPNLSDDYYRFIWDGRLLAQGINPFLHSPAHYMTLEKLPEGLSAALYGQLNSPQYHTVYPPVCQLVFGLAGWLFSSSDRATVLLIKLFLLGCEVVTIIGLTGLTPRPPLQGRGGGDSNPRTLSPSPLERGPRGEASLFYALNPLAILEITGNCHFEGAMICFLVLGLRALERGKLTAGAAWWALATASKLLPPLFLPLAWRWLGWRKGWRFNLLFGLFCLLLFAPLLQPEVLRNMGSSLRLYFRQFEFNASLYYLVKFSANQFSKYETGRVVGPVLSLATMLGVIVLAFWKLKKNSPTTTLWDAMGLASTLYLFHSTTVHPWYATAPLALLLNGRRRFAVVWSGLIALSYSHYNGGAFEEKWGLIALEYGLLWAWIAAETWRLNRPG